MESHPIPTIFVIGTASLDTLHFAGQTAQAAGGAGLYTALAAHCSNASAGLFAPRPNPLPEALRTTDERLQWHGPQITPESLSRLEIEHHGGGRATLLDASWGAEAELLPTLMPTALYRAQFIHIAALSSAQRQLDFAQALLATRGDTRRPQLSVGTYGRLVSRELARVQQLFELADLFFMNENEAQGLFGEVPRASTRPGALLFVTLGERGALVIEGTHTTHVPGWPATELDPTGAGDTFCGATLAGLSQGLPPVDAATRGAALAAKTVSGVGPAALLDTS